MFIPNSQTPNWTVVSFDEKWIRDNIVSNQEELREDPLRLFYTLDNSVGDIKFPSTEKFDQPQITLDTGEVFELPANKRAGYWGYLENLYINANKVTSLLDTSNSSIKDVLYQILNSLSEAASGIWNFQIIESQIEEVTRLSIVDMSFVTDNTGDDENMLKIDLIGSKSILISSNFSMDLPDSVKNNVVTKRLGDPLNSDEFTTPKRLFSYDKDGNPLEDKVLNKINTKTSDVSGGNQKNTKVSDEAKEEERKQFAKKLYTEQLGIAPKSEFSKKGEISDTASVFDYCYLTAYDNPGFFSLLKIASDLETPTVSPLQPIEFEFTIHGISGIKRSDKFQVNGIPEKFKRGFFQVTEVSHDIKNMKWTTSVKGGFRGG